MKKTITILITLALVAGTLAGCNEPASTTSTVEPNQMKSQVASTEEVPTESETPEEVSDEAPVATAETTPVVGRFIANDAIPEAGGRLKMYETYFITHMPFTFFGQTFDQDTMEKVLGGYSLHFDFEAFYADLNEGKTYFEDHPEHQTPTKTFYDAAIFEETIMAFFNVTPEQIQQNALYNKEDNAYVLDEGGLGTPTSYQVVIEKSEENRNNRTVKIYYTYYATNEYVGTEDFNTWVDMEGGVTIRQEDGMGFKYLANEATTYELPEESNIGVRDIG